MDDESLTEGLVRSPLGATLLHVLEGDWSPEGFGARPLKGPRPVEAVAESVTEMTTDDLTAAMLGASTRANPWSGTPQEVTQALSTAPERRSVAKALVAAHGPFLTAVLDRNAQVAWRGSPLPAPLIGNLASVYECGEFPWGGLRTHAALSSRHDRAIWWAHDVATSTELTVWRFPARPEARVVEIDSPAAWLNLVRRHPRQVNPFRRERRGLRRFLASGHNAWDIQLRSIEPDGTATVGLIDGSELKGVRGLLMPDWTSVATECDGVHISWAGLFLAEGNVVDAGDGWLAVARFWGSERTVFLSDVFDQPEPVGKVKPQ